MPPTNGTGLFSVPHRSRCRIGSSPNVEAESAKRRPALRQFRLESQSENFGLILIIMAGSFHPEGGDILDRSHQTVERCRFGDVAIKSSGRRLFDGRLIAPGGVGY